MVIRASTELAIARIEGAPEGAPDAIDVRCARLALAWASLDPLCCATGALVDLRARLALERAGVALPWSSAPPVIDGRASSGVVSALATRDSCGAVGSDAVRGEGCAIRAHDPALLLDDCALFPLDVVGGTLVPSSRLPLHARVASDGAPCLWDDARARVATRFGDAYAARVDEVVRGLRARGGRKLHLRTLR